ncbi:high mobility group box domain-containing protein [Gilbertella persicaria]|uniref:high mobility group box domain-containing protein n=1 Tax=Gilbertella persicaria TaxID=101096 RepID=UPI002220189B|nr:high mobility group box domain-containing protein [Gilbertella persicaria]KAI8066997.1 high mobility group box domain-containing protein [Gilbertella persicaria]
MDKSSQMSLDYSDNSDLGSEIYSHDESDMKDPNAPKGPGNVFFLYCRLERDKIKDEHPTENLGEVTRLLGQKWKSLTKEEKKKYYDMYKRELEEYEEAMKTYTLNGGVVPPHDVQSNIGNNEDAGMISIVSSPAQTEMSMDFASDPAQHHDSPEVNAFMDEEVMASQQPEVFHHEPVGSSWQQAT